MKVIIPAILVCFLISGCQSAPTENQIYSADYGPFPDRYKEIIKDYMRHALKDPDSAQYVWQTPYAGWSTKPAIFGGGLDKFGWIVRISVNAKNSFGGYIGYGEYVFLFRGNDDFKILSIPHRSTIY